MEESSGIRRFVEALSTCHRVSLDTNAVIYYLSSTGPYGVLMGHLFRLVEQGSLDVVLSSIVQMELLIAPIKRGDSDAFAEVIDFTEKTPNLRTIDSSRSIVLQAAFARADGLEVPDSLIVATGIVAQCDAIVTNDGRWRGALRRMTQRQPMVQGDAPLTLPPILYLDNFVDS